MLVKIDGFTRPSPPGLRPSSRPLVAPTLRRPEAGGNGLAYAFRQKLRSDHPDPTDRSRSPSGCHATRAGSAWPRSRGGRGAPAQDEIASEIDRAFPIGMNDHG